MGSCAGFGYELAEVGRAAVIHEQYIALLKVRFRGRPGQIDQIVEAGDGQDEGTQADGFIGQLRLNLFDFAIQAELRIRQIQVPYSLWIDE